MDGIEDKGNAHKHSLKRLILFLIEDHGISSIPFRIPLAKR